MSATGRIAARFGANGAGRLLGRKAAADERLGEALVAELDQLKGMAMKVGQIISYMDVGLSPAVTDKLARLRAGVRPLAGDVIVEVIEAELQQPVDVAFASFEDQAMAAASIGQVHRARTHDGRKVVVKVRYPGVAETMKTDFAFMHRLGGIAGSFTVVDGHAVVDELQARVLEECDYQREARWQRRFAEILAGDPDISVPAVVPALSTSGVLTSEEHVGWDFERFCAEATPEARTRTALALLRLTFLPLFTRGVLHADPHPGNQLYRADGSLVALDFGCVREFDDAFMQAHRGFIAAVIAGDRPDFEIRAQQVGLAPKPDKIDWGELWDTFRWMHAPVLQPEFEFSRAWWEQGRRFTSPSAKNARHQGFPPEWIWLHRVQWGLWAVLVAIGARGDFSTPFRSWLSRGRH